MKSYQELKEKKDISILRIIIYGVQLAFALFGIMLSLGALSSGGFLNFIAASFLVVSALIIAPIIDFIPIIKKYSLISLIPRAAISFALVVIAVFISPSKNDAEKPTREAITTTSANEYLEETTTLSVTTITTTHESTTTTTTVTTTKTTTSTVVTTTTTAAITTMTYIRNGNLNGRGTSDNGREEPNYENVIGYVVVGSKQQDEIEKTDNFSDLSLWNIPTYEKDKQFWNETGVTIPHKTEVVVVEQFLTHRGWGFYYGYLLVKKLDDDTEYYINVDNFITKPYWTYSKNLSEASKIGNYVAVFNQKSDFYPTDRDGKKVEIPDGQKVLVTGEEYGKIEAYVWKQWRLGYGGVTVCFEPDDLEIIY